MLPLEKIYKQEEIDLEGIDSLEELVEYATDLYNRFGDAKIETDWTYDHARYVVEAFDRMETEQECLRRMFLADRNHEAAKLKTLDNRIAEISRMAARPPVPQPYHSETVVHDFPLDVPITPEVMDAALAAKPGSRFTYVNGVAKLVGRSVVTPERVAAYEEELKKYFAEMTRVQKMLNDDLEVLHKEREKQQQVVDAVKQKYVDMGME